ncbi:MAG: RNA polymerase subunit sigma [Planctomycetota bacterium]|nr:MAG: RNA polymerase subunit sigma [Planctomycetota bacterium]
MPAGDDLTRLLAATAAGDAVASEALLDQVHGELVMLARCHMSNERPGHTLQATALVSEAWLRLAGDGAPFANRAHFVAAAAEAMRRILIEHARARGRVKRGGRARRVPLAGVDLAGEVQLDQVLAVDEAIERLEQRDPELAKLVRLRFYAGLDVRETASALDVSERTVRREWALARAFLAKELGADRGG